jgi:hypothetical protein
LCNTIIGFFRKPDGLVFDSIDVEKAFSLESLFEVFKVVKVMNSDKMPGLDNGIFPSSKGSDQDKHYGGVP